LYLSIIFVLYVLTLSISAVQFSSETEKHLNPEIKKIVSLDPKEQELSQLRMISALPLITLSIDLVIVNAMAVLGSYAGLQCVSKERYKTTKQCRDSNVGIFIVFPMVLVVVFFVALGLVIIGIASQLSILTHLGIASMIISAVGHIIIVLFCAAYVYMRPRRKKLLYLSVWRSCAYSFMFPLCCLANHLNYIILAFVHDLYHATSVAIA